MSSWAGPRFTAGSGALAVVLYGVVAAMMSDAPGVEVGAPEVHAWVAGHRNEMLAAAYLWGLCTCATMGFLAGLWGALKERSPTFAMLGLAGGFSVFTLAFAGFALWLGAAYGVAHQPPATTKLLADLNYLFVSMTGFPTAVSMGGFLAAMHRHPRVPAALQGLGVVVVAAHLLSAGAFAASGLLSPSGVGVYVAPVLYYLWILGVSLALLRDPTGFEPNPGV